MMAIGAKNEFADAATAPMAMNISPLMIFHVGLDPITAFWTPGAGSDGTKTYGLAGEGAAAKPQP